MQINEMPADQRPREKLLMHGAAHLSDAELLAIFLRTGLKGCSAIELAEQIIDHFQGCTRQLLTAHRQAFDDIAGIGDAKYAQLAAVVELAKRYLRAELKHGQALTSPQAAEEFLLAELRDEPSEVFACIWLDNQNQVITFERLFQGTINAASVYPREVVRQAIAHNAAAVIFTHNHPSGLAEPSDADKRLTDQLKQVLSVIDVRALDHLIVAGGQVVSLAQRGLM
ncbi:RadC family protein [Salinibius halmophilus]|uniref:RadC family protein n=1 Tax=Salinibius halmophilus TaxID=1853216 RepID=UPI000E669DDA|nr:DNA repair protein RadC [Salinibius halmophilus]